MYELILKNRSKIISRKKYSSKDEIEDFLYQENHEEGFEFEIIEQSTGKVIEEGDVESSDDIRDASMGDMFPDEEDMESFDWTE